MDSDKRSIKQILDQIIKLYTICQTSRNERIINESKTVIDVLLMKCGFGKK